MRKTLFLITLALVLALTASSAWADNVTGLTTFSSGTPAFAASINANFSEIKDSVDDNNTRITSLENVLAGAAETTWTNYVLLTDDTPAVVTSNTIAIPAPGIVVAIATGFVFHSHTNGVEDDMAIELSDTTAGSSVVQNVIGMTHTRIPYDVPTSYYWGIGYSITRTFNEGTAGSKKYYINAELDNGTNSFVYNSHLTLLYLPAAY